MKSHCRTYYASTVRIETQPSDDCSKASENHRKLGVSNQNRGFRDHKTSQNRLPKPRPKPLQNRSRKPALNSPIGQVSGEAKYLVSDSSDGALTRALTFVTRAPIFVTHARHLGDIAQFRHCV